MTAMQALLDLILTRPNFTTKSTKTCAFLFRCELCVKMIEYSVNETLFSQIQKLLERTYAQVGINLEDCIIDRARCAQLSKLAGASARELSELARTFFVTPAIGFTSAFTIRAGSSTNSNGTIRAAV